MIVILRNYLSWSVLRQISADFDEPSKNIEVDFFSDDLLNTSFTHRK